MSNGLTTHNSPLTAHFSPPTSHCSPLTSHCSQLTSHLSLLTSHLSLLTSHLPPPTSHLPPLTAHLSLLTSHHPLLTSHFSLLTSHNSPPTSHCSPLTTHLSLLTAHLSLLTPHLSSPTKMRDFHKLVIWQRSHQLTLDIYMLTQQFPKEELFGITSQIRRSVSSIPTNIAEGCGRETNKDFAHFLQISIGSACETEYQLLLAHDLNYITDKEYIRLNDEIVSVRKMIHKYQSGLKSSQL